VRRYKDILTLKYPFTVTISCKRVLSDTRTEKVFNEGTIRRRHRWAASANATPKGRYRSVLSEAGLFLANQATGYSYGTGLRVRHGPARRRGSLRMCVLSHHEAV
jgi:hypothetical protein